MKPAESSADLDDVGSALAGPSPEVDRSLATGGIILTVATMASSAGNYLLNLLLARWLEPAEFADANLMVTLMLLVTALAVGLQLVTARFVGVYVANGRESDSAALNRRLTKWSIVAGVFLGAISVGAAPWWSALFRTESAIPFVILGLGWPFYLAQAVGRGLLQGSLRLNQLAATFIVEMIVRVTIALLLVAMGFGVAGATMGLSISFFATWAHVTLLTGKPARSTMSAGERQAVVRYSQPVALLLLAQIVINNSDVLVAKRFLEPDAAGVYSAVALVGRGVFFLSWAVASTLFPAVVQRHESGQDSNRLLGVAVLVVAAIGVVIVVGAYGFGGPVLALAAGPEYAGTSRALAGYAVATVMFACANLVATFHLSTDRTRETKILLLGGVMQTTLLLIGRSSIEQLITAQILAMGGLAAMVLTSHLAKSWYGAAVSTINLNPVSR